MGGGKFGAGLDGFGGEMDGNEDRDSDWRRGKKSNDFLKAIIAILGDKMALFPNNN
jgi:hypothetical protein